MSQKRNRFPNWNDLYNEDVKTMPWYTEELDADLENELKQRNITRGRFLDLGTGPGTQAIRLAKLGFNVTASDLSENAIRKALLLDGNVNFVVDDILFSKFQKNSFDYIFDRGCFHVLPNSEWSKYSKKILELLDVNRLFFLKCFSIKEKELGYGPYRFTESELRRIFENDFVIEKIIDGVFQGTLNPLPKALFAVMRKQK